MQKRKTDNHDLLPYDEAILEDTYRDKPVDKLGLIALHSDALKDALVNQSSAERRVLEIVRTARADGLSWAEVGELFGVSRQAAYERWDRFVEK